MDTLRTDESAPAETDEPGVPRWHPFTPAGCARGVFAPPWQVWLLAFVVAIACGLTLRSLAHRAWIPVIETSLAALPEEGGIEHGLLLFPGAVDARVLGGNTFLSLGLGTVAGAPLPVDSASDIRVRLLSDRWEACSLAGCMSLFYGADAQFPLNRLETPAWWAAWKPMIMLTLVTVAAFGLFVVWVLLGWMLNLPLQFFAFFADRAPGWAGGVRLAVLSLLPGALMMNGGLLAYGFGWFDLFDLAIVFALHLVAGWLWLVFAARALPRVATETPPAKVNPFSTPGGAGPRKPRNPFAGS